jgi:hypothetical protein
VLAWLLTAGFNKLIAHGVTGGVRSRLSGGSFKSGFLGSAVSYGASWSGAYEAGPPYFLYYKAINVSKIVRLLQFVEPLQYESR